MITMRHSRKGVTLVEVMMVCLLILMFTVSVYQMLLPAFRRVQAERSLVSTRTGVDFVHVVLATDLRQSTNVALTTSAGQKVLTITLPSGTVRYVLQNGTLSRIDDVAGVNTVLLESGVENLSYRYTTLHEVTVDVRDISGKISAIKVMAAARR